MIEKPASGSSEAAHVGRSRAPVGWLEERLGVQALFQKYGRKVFPVHSSFFLGEMALFSFIILVLTGTYLGFIYVPSNAEITVEGETLPEAYASVRLIESVPVADLFRNTHHWAAHVMIAAVLLHMLRVFFTGTYRKPREINWVVGIVLLGLSLMAGFVGYALPYDAYAVTATGIGYSIARSIPWVGEFAAELFFGGAFPTLGSLARLYTIHVFILPAIITLVMGAHLLIIVKQKHSQPGYAREQAEPGKVLGVPLIPYQGLLAGQLLLLMFGALFLVSAFVPPHPLEAFGPPQAATPEVKPDWYLLWIYGFLKIVPSDVAFTIWGATIGPDFLGGLLFPAFLFGVLTLTPWMDRTNRRASRRFEYLEPIRQSPTRTALGIAVLTFIGTLFLAAYYDEIGMNLREIWTIVIAVPIAVGLIVALLMRMGQPATRFDPREELAPLLTARSVATEPTRSPEPAAGPGSASTTTGVHRSSTPETTVASLDPPRRMTTPSARSEHARDSVANLLEQMGEIAPLVRESSDSEEMRGLLDYIDSLRAELGDSNDALQGVVRAEEAERET